MEDIFKNYEKTIHKKHSVNFNPKYKEEFRTSVNNTLFVAIAEKAVERLGWDVVFKGENSLEAKRKEKSLGVYRWTEAITASYESGKVVVKSESLGSEIWDLGRNSKRVKLFIYAFEETLKTFDNQALNELEKEVEKKNNWDDYVMPESLPQPIPAKEPNILIPIVGGLAVSLILGFVLALISVKAIYIICLFEFLVATGITLTMKRLIKLSNFTDFHKMQYLLAGMIILVYFSNQYFQYEIILNENDYGRIGLLEFLRLKISQGLIIEGIDTGWIGLVISWILQLGLTGLFVYSQMVAILAKYKIERVPVEVIDFVYYHFVKGKTTEDVRSELAQKGWTEKTNQDEVFKAIGSFQHVKELRRMK